MAPDSRGRLTAWAVVAVLGAASWAAPAAAQALFQWPDTAVDVSRYTTVEECMAATARSLRLHDLAASRLVWTDTMPDDPRRPLESAPREVTATAARCAARFDAARVDLEYFADYFTLFLEAGRDSDAATLLRRRLAAAHTAGEREAVEDSVVTTYLAARPVRLAAAETILRARARTVQDPDRRMLAFGTLLVQERMVGDSVAAHATAAAMLQLYASLDAADQERVRSGMFRFAAVWALYSYLGNQPIRDSLRHSTAAYVRLLDSIWTRATGLRSGALAPGVGEKAPRLEADSWFPADSGAAPRPAAGRVTLVVVLPSAMFRSAFDPAFGSLPSGALREVFARLRRIADRFPGLQIIVETRTLGHYYFDTAGTPASEAALIRQGLEAAVPPRSALLAVASTQYWRLPAPDDRRIDRTTVDDTSYAFGRGEALGSEATLDTPDEFLVDQDGIVVASGLLDHGSLIPTDVLIEALLARRGASGAESAATPGRE